MLIVIDSVFQIVSYYEYLEGYKYYFDVQIVCLALLVFSLFWSLIGLIYVIIAQIYSNKWKNLEKDFVMREELRKDYETLFLNETRTEAQTREMEILKQSLEYFLMKQEFIYPTFLPVVGEAFLREDFDFGSYLDKCIGKTVTFIFKYSYNTVFAIITISLIWFTFTYINGPVQFAIMMSVPVIFFIVLYTMKENLDDIYDNVISQVDTPYAISFTRFDNIRQANINLDKMKVPKYLEKEIDYIQQKKKFSASLNYPNRQEMLFWFKSPKFTARLIHLIMILEIIWMTAFCCRYYLRMRIAEEYACAILGTMITLFNLLYFIPHNIKEYSIVSNVSMFNMNFELIKLFYKDSNA